MHVFGLGVEAGRPGENPGGYTEASGLGDPNHDPVQCNLFEIWLIPTRLPSSKLINRTI